MNPEALSSVVSHLLKPVSNVVMNADPTSGAVDEALINMPHVVAELRDVYNRYERALMASDTATVQSMFLDQDFTVRYAPAANQHGYAEVSAGIQSNGPFKRVIDRMTVTTFGFCFGTVNIEDWRPETGRCGRQSQTWVRTAEGWRVVSAHVSLLPDTADRRLNERQGRI